MTKVPQYDWSKLTPATPEKKVKPRYLLERDKGPRISRKQPVRKTPKKFKDRHLGNVFSHLKAIMRED